MSTRLKKHGAVRAQQRGFCHREIELVCAYGTEIPDHHCDVYFLRKKDIYDALGDLNVHDQRLLRESKGSTVVLDGCEVITVYRASRRGEKEFRKR
tara:strand:+ start:31768 stop:32055 length:288 start_codon:yes stop_codon:yes gene_type:complete